MPTGFEGMTRERFLGSPEIIEDADVRVDYNPSKRARVSSQRVPFLDRFAAYIDKRECVVFEGDEVIALHKRFSSFMVTRVDKHRGQGIAPEMIFRVALLNPGKPLPGGRRTARNFRCCSRAWDKIEALHHG